MPKLTCWCVRAAMFYLLLGFILGGLLLSAKGGAVDLRVWLWLPAHIDALIVGWMIQLAMAMTVWILPGRLVISRRRVAFAWAAFGLLNMGLLITLGPSLLRYWFPQVDEFGNAFVLGLVVQVSALVLFAAYVWQRVSSIGLPKPPIHHSFFGAPGFTGKVSFRRTQ